MAGCKFAFKVSIEMNHIEGKFISKDEIVEEMRNALEGADPGEYSNGDGTYEVAAWDIEQD